MSAAFEAGAGFSGQNFTYFILCLIGVLAVAWSIIIINGWLGLYKSADDPMTFLLNRLGWLALLWSLLIALIGV